ncbi:ribosome-associated translation inhibitor RaiA [Oscillospiraceae bacterium HV4-5-C5C]|nr:ribosome-associated translation inhibitor RaiA [Oscillospiraceae bacterium HV4-5-C5C]
MEINITGKGLKVSDQTKEKVLRKLKKFDRYFGDSAHASVKLRPEGDQICVEITMKLNNRYLRAETMAEDVLTATDDAVEVLERQVRKHKTRLAKDIHDYAYLQESLKYEPEETEEDEDEFGILRRKQFELTPMTEEEACLQMDMLGHSFHLFLSADTGKVCVVYKRRDHNYGIIEPVY